MSLEDKIYNHLKELYSNNFSFNEGTFLSTLLKAMEMVESYKKLTGLEKKTMVKDLMKKLLQELDVDPAFAGIKDYYLANESALDSHIDTLISVSKGFYNLNKKDIHAFFKKIGALFKCCVPL